MDKLMHAYFHLGFKDYVLFEDFYTQSVGAMVGACFAMFALGILLEAIKFFREYLNTSSSSSSKISKRDASNHDNSFMPGCSQEKISKPWPSELTLGTACRQMFSLKHLAQTVLHVVQVVLSYCLMLVVMSFNVWLVLSVILGAGLGYGAFRWRNALSVDRDEEGVAR